MARTERRTFIVYSDADLEETLTSLESRLNDGGSALADAEFPNDPIPLTNEPPRSLPTRFTITYWESIDLYDDDPQIPDRDKTELLEIVRTLLSESNPDIATLETRDIDIQQTTGGMRALTPTLPVESLHDHHATLQWGVLIPVTTGLSYALKTGGIASETTLLEGIFVPLDRPTTADDEDLLDELIQINQRRPGKHERHDDVPIYMPATDQWERIQAAMDVEFEYVRHPSGYPRRDEGYVWINLTDVGDTEWMKRLQDETIALVYPNSD